MGSNYDIEMSSDDTLELDTIIKESNIASDPINDLTYYGDSSYSENILKNFETHTTVFDPPEPGEYDINVNGQVLSINVTDASAIPESGVTRYSCENSNSDTSVITDIWGSNGATNVNGVSYNSSEGPGGNGEYQYDRSQDQYSSTSIKNYNDSFTFALLAKHTDVDNVDLMADLSGSITGVQFTYRSDDMEFKVHDSNSNTTKISTNVNTSNTYQWFIMTHDESTGEIRAYLDKTEYGPSYGTHEPNPDSNIRIAKRGTRSTNYPTMDMADFRYYNKPISQLEVNNLVDTGSI